MEGANFVLFILMCYLNLAKNETPPAETKAPSEGELIQLICAGCEKGFDDEDQFAGHECTTKQDT